MEKITITIYHRLMGGHIHMRIFIFGGLVGNLIMKEEEFEHFKNRNFELNFQEE